MRQSLQHSDTIIISSFCLFWWGLIKCLNIYSTTKSHNRKFCIDILIIGTNWTGKSWHFKILVGLCKCTNLNLFLLIWVDLKTYLVFQLTKRAIWPQRGSCKISTSNWWSGKVPTNSCLPSMYNGCKKWIPHKKYIQRLLQCKFIELNIEIGTQFFYIHILNKPIKNTKLKKLYNFLVLCSINGFENNFAPFFQLFFGDADCDRGLTLFWQSGFLFLKSNILSTNSASFIRESGELLYEKALKLNKQDAGKNLFLSGVQSLTDILNFFVSSL